MATAAQMDACAAALIARGVVPDRMIGPPDVRGQLARFLIQGYSNEHLGQLPGSDAEFLAWAGGPYSNNHNLRRYWPPGSVDVKTDGAQNPPPWDWAPMGCPAGRGCNDDDWTNHAPWPADGGCGAGAPPSSGGATGGGQVPVPVGGGAAAPIALPIIGTGGLAPITLPGIGPVSPLVLGVAGLALVMALRRR